jgi:hypothetical protein
VESPGPPADYLLLALLSTAAGVAAMIWPGITALVLTIWIAGTDQVGPPAPRPGSPRAGRATALVDEPLAAAAVVASKRRGYLDGRTLAEVFAWLRPGDLIWNYWVNNYLLGKRPPAFDILFWNSDTTRMPARLHADFVQLAMGNQLVTPAR